MNITAEKIVASRFLTVKQLPNYYPAFTESSIRWLIFNSKANGFFHCIRRIGRKILIDLDQFEHWIDQQNTQGGVNHARA